MRVLTTYPIYVNKKRESQNDYYLSAEGVKVKTAYPLYINNKKVDNDSYYLSIDGTNPAEVMAFQTFANTKGALLSVDGKYTRKDGNKSNTQKAYDKWGAEWEKTRVPATTTTTPTTTTPTTAEPTMAQKEEAKKKGLFWDKAKGGWAKAKESGLLDTLGGLFGFGAPKTQETTFGGETINTTPPKDDKKKMSTTTKVLIGVGAVAVIGTIVYLATRKK